MARRLLTFGQSLKDMRSLLEWFVSSLILRKRGEPVKLFVVTGSGARDGREWLAVRDACIGSSGFFNELC